MNTPFYHLPLRWPEREYRARLFAGNIRRLPLIEQRWSIADTVAMGVGVDITQRVEYLPGHLASAEVW